MHDLLPYIILKFAVTEDGYLDDKSKNRLIISNEEDFYELDKVRSSCDIIVIGGETLRRDNPRLLIKDQSLKKERLNFLLNSDLDKAVISKSKNLPEESNFFKLGDCQKFVLSNTMPINLYQLALKGYSRIIIEGGAKIIGQVIDQNLFNELQISQSNRKINNDGKSHYKSYVTSEFFENNNHDSMKEFGFIKMKNYFSKNKFGTYLSNNEIYNITSAIDTKFIKICIELSKRCPKSDKAFSVGAVILNEQNKIVSTGYSREIKDTYHAEEVVILKAQKLNEDLSKCRLYTSLEPCGERSSSPNSCCDLIIKNRIPIVIFACPESTKFVNPKGVKILEQNGTKILIYEKFKNEVEKVNKHLY